MFIGDVLVCDHKLSKFLLFITRFEMEAWPTGFLSDCKSFFFFISIFLHFVYSSVPRKNVKWRVNTFILIFVHLFTVFHSWIFLLVKPLQSQVENGRCHFSGSLHTQTGFWKIKKVSCRFTSIETWSAWSDYLRISISIITVFFSKFLHQWSV